jgi:hypothetical protein
LKTPNIFPQYCKEAIDYFFEFWLVLTRMESRQDPMPGRYRTLLPPANDNVNQVLWPLRKSDGSNLPLAFVPESLPLQLWKWIDIAAPGGTQS